MTFAIYVKRQSGQPVEGGLDCAVRVLLDYMYLLNVPCIVSGESQAQAEKCCFLSE